MAAATIVHDTSEAVELCGSCGLYLKPITKMIISVALPQLKQPGKSISNWEVMERLKGMVNNHQFSTLRISKSTMDFIRFEGEVENKSLVKTFLAALDGKSIKLSGFSDILKVRAVEYKLDFPTRHDWDSFFRDAKDMNESLPGERPDTIHLEGLPCKWFALKDSGSEKPNEDVLIKVFNLFGEIRMVDIPMLDPYREEMTGRSFHTFSFGGHLNFEAYVQYKEYVGFVKAMNALRGMKLMYKGEDGKAVACNIKVSFDSTKHLSEASIKKRQLERQKLQELEQRREEQKRKEKEAEERQKEEERKQKELEEVEKERKRIEKIRRKEEKQKEREARRNKKKLQKIQAEEQKKLQEKIRFEERRLLLAQRNLQSIRIIAELLSQVKATKLNEQEEMEAERLRLLQLEERRKEQEAELKRVEEEKQRALGLQRKERELREKLVKSFLNRSMCSDHQKQDQCSPVLCFPLKPNEDTHQEPRNYVTSTSTQTPSGNEPLKLHSLYANSTTKNGVCCEMSALQEYKQASVIPGHVMSLHSILGNSAQHNTSVNVQNCSLKESEVHKNGTEQEEKEQQTFEIHCQTEDKARKHKSKHKRDVSSDVDGRKKVKKSNKTHFSGDRSPRQQSSGSPKFSKHKSKHLKDRHDHKRKRHRRRSYSRERESWSS
ncbi:hypothetical protein XENTR_v10005192 [Xenopus tropicalis]|nr:A-kinase anchor protein 17A [Xenopus tropicalis]KAE8622322.1 hypothetical protein XENTR_v10005192 [Xenopus tropicalis]|eukprot:NP_001128287.2 A-kinase anchor protein 17A [Xenopus tropicalis]